MVHEIMPKRENDDAQAIIGITCTLGTSIFRKLPALFFLLKDIYCQVLDIS